VREYRVHERSSASEMLGWDPFGRLPRGHSVFHMGLFSHVLFFSFTLACALCIVHVGIQNQANSPRVIANYVLSFAGKAFDDDGEKSDFLDDVSEMITEYITGLRGLGAEEGRAAVRQVFILRLKRLKAHALDVHFRGVSRPFKANPLGWHKWRKKAAKFHELLGTGAIQLWQHDFLDVATRVDNRAITDATDSTDGSDGNVADADANVV
jgi:hypothetical protein